MIWMSLNGKTRNVSITKYMIDWEGRKISRPQQECKNFIKPYWIGDVVLEEFRIPGSRQRIDLMNVNKKIVIEISPTSVHAQYNPFFHKSMSGYIASIKRDLTKEKICTANGFTFVEITDNDPLTPEFFLKTYGVVL